MGLEEAGGIPEQVVAEFGRAAQFVAVAAGGGLDKVGVQGGEALQVAARTVAFDDVDVCAGPGIEPAGQVLGEQRGEQHRRHRDFRGDAAADGEEAGRRADEGDGGGGEPQGSGEGVQGEVPGGASGQPAQGRALRAVRARCEYSDLVGDLGLAAVAGDGPGEPSPGGAFVDE
ncbi:hypothetical protein AB0E25_38535 [Streptomyces bobili]|uniref:hypothetical protein n=1 Tax=Streptomyces bobili TaxID=67280 RepID=UPI00340498FC